MNFILESPIFRGELLVSGRVILSLASDPIPNPKARKKKRKSLSQKKSPRCSRHLLIFLGVDSRSMSQWWRRKRIVYHDDHDHDHDCDHDRHDDDDDDDDDHHHHHHQSPHFNNSLPPHFNMDMLPLPMLLETFRSMPMAWWSWRCYWIQCRRVWDRPGLFWA